MCGVRGGVNTRKDWVGVWGGLYWDGWVGGAGRQARACEGVGVLGEALEGGVRKGSVVGMW